MEGIQLLGLALFGSMAILSLVNLIIKWQRVTTAPSRRSYDVSNESQPPPKAVYEMLKILEEIGFVRLGEVAIDVLPLSKKVTWLLTKNKGMILAEVIKMEDKAACQFTTIFRDESILETSFPIGENIDKPNYRSRKNEVSLQAAFEQHMHHARAIHQQRGNPQAINSISDYLQREGRYRELYLHYKTNINSLWKDALYPVFFAAAAAFYVLVDV